MHHKCDGKIVFVISFPIKDPKKATVKCILVRPNNTISISRSTKERSWGFQKYLQSILVVSEELIIQSGSFQE